MLIGADFIPTDTNTSLFESGDISALVGDDICSLFENSDYTVFNLEAPICEKTAPILKCGVNLVASNPTINTYKKAGIDLFALANNHILDYGEKGLLDTIKTLEDNNIAYVGAGKNHNAAKIPYTFIFADKTVGVYACCEHEFSCAGKNSYGANPIDLLYSFDDVKKLKDNSDYVMVFFHGGKEYYRYPTPDLQRLCRKFVESGADLVVCQHTHCIGCEEKYNGGTIVYGQGDFLFDFERVECRNTGLIIKLDDEFKIEYIPLIKKNNTVRLAKDKTKDDILDAFFERSREITQDGFVDKRFDELVDDVYHDYLLDIHAERLNIFKRVINKLCGGKYFKHKAYSRYKGNALFKAENRIRCETHREILLSGMKKRR